MACTHALPGDCLDGLPFAIIVEAALHSLPLPPGGVNDPAGPERVTPSPAQRDRASIRIVSAGVRGIWQA